MICFSNLIAAGIGGSQFVYVADALRVVLIVIYYLLGVLLEEFLFRLFIQNSLVGVSSIKRIVGSAAIFAIFHLLNIVNISQVDQLINVLVQVVYAFGLGLVLALIYEYTYSLPACIVFHFIFNFFNKIMVEDVFRISFDTLAYYLTAVVIGVIAVAYGILLYLFVLNKHDRYFRQ